MAKNTSVAAMTVLTALLVSACGTGAKEEEAEPTSNSVSTTIITQTETVTATIPAIATSAEPRTTDSSSPEQTLVLEPKSMQPNLDINYDGLVLIPEMDGSVGISGSFRIAPASSDQITDENGVPVKLDLSKLTFNCSKYFGPLDATFSFSLAEGVEVAVSGKLAPGETNASTTYECNAGRMTLLIQTQIFTFQGSPNLG